MLQGNFSIQHITISVEKDKTSDANIKGKKTDNLTLKKLTPVIQLSLSSIEFQIRKFSQTNLFKYRNRLVPYLEA